MSEAVASGLVYPVWWRAVSGVVAVATLLVFLGLNGLIDLPSATYNYEMWLFVPFFGLSWVIEQRLPFRRNKRDARESVNG